MNGMSETTDRMLRTTDQRLAGLEHDARQPRLAMEADLSADKKTRKRVKDAAADQAKHGDRCSAKRVDTGSTTLISFGMKAKPPALLAGMTVWSTKALKRQSRVSHPIRRAR